MNASIALFAILLVILTIISIFGGSARSTLSAPIVSPFEGFASGGLGSDEGGVVMPPPSSGALQMNGAPGTEAVFDASTGSESQAPLDPGYTAPAQAAYGEAQAAYGEAQASRGDAQAAYDAAPAAPEPFM